MKISCPLCNITGDIPDNSIGRTITCKCGNKFMVQSKETTFTVEPSPLNLPSNNNSLKNSIAIIVIILILCGLTIGLVNLKNNFITSNTNNNNNYIPDIQSIVTNKNIVTLDKYNKIQTGMSYEKVVKIIGDKGTETSSSTMDGIPGVMSSITTKMYQWQNNDGSNMLIMTQNNKVTTKSQYGL